MESAASDKMYATKSVVREAWKFEAGVITVDFEAAKSVAHAKRRAKREEGYNVVDGGNMFVVLDAEGQALRQKVKTPDDACQEGINNASDETSLILVMQNAGLS